MRFYAFINVDTALKPGDWIHGPSKPGRTTTGVVVDRTYTIETHIGMRAAWILDAIVDVIARLVSIKAHLHSIRPREIRRQIKTSCAYTFMPINTIKTLISRITARITCAVVYVNASFHVCHRTNSESETTCTAAGVPHLPEIIYAHVRGIHTDPIFKSDLGQTRIGCTSHILLCFGTLLR
jgi:hypothetical protein